MARTFKKRGDWWIDYRGSDGKRHREPVGAGASYSLAKEVLAKRLTAVSEQRHFPGRVANAKPFSEVMDGFWEKHGRFMRGESWGGCFKVIRRTFGSKRIGSITAGDCQAFYNEIAAPRQEGQPPRYSTANRYLTLLRLIFNRAADWGEFHGDNPCGRVRKGKEPAHRIKFLSQEEMTRLLDVSHPRLRPIVACALLTGMRRGEMLTLTWENVSLETDTIHILRSKSGKARQVPVGAKLREVLTTLGPRESGSVFELSEIMLRRYFDVALRKAGILDFRFHDLRHTFASHFVMRTNDLPTLQMLLGHSSPVMTQRYAHLSKGHLATNVAVFESAIPLNGASGTLNGHQERHQGIGAALGRA